MLQALENQEGDHVRLDLDLAAQHIPERLLQHRELVPERVRARAPKPLVTHEEAVHIRFPPETRHQETLVPAEWRSSTNAQWTALLVA